MYLCNNIHTGRTLVDAIQLNLIRSGRLVCALLKYKYCNCFGRGRSCYDGNERRKITIKMSIFQHVERDVFIMRCQSPDVILLADWRALHAHSVHVLEVALCTVTSRTCHFITVCVCPSQRSLYVNSNLFKCH